MSPAQTDTAAAFAEYRPQAPLREQRPAPVAAIPLFVALTTVGAYLAFPLPGTPVPVTLQTLFVLLSGVLLGSVARGVRDGGLLGLGCTRSTGLLGWSQLTCVAPRAHRRIPGIVSRRGLRGRLDLPRKPGLAGARLAFTVGTIVILLGGVAQLAVMTGQSLSSAALVGALPFLPGAAVKAGIGIGAVRWLEGRPGR